MSVKTVALSLKKNIFYNVLLNIANVAFPIITVPYTSRVLGVENIGVVNFATTYASYFVLFATLGIPIYGMREIAKHSANPMARSKVFSELFTISVVTTIIAVVVYLLTIYTIPSLRKDYVFLLIAGSYIIFTPLSVDWFFTGRENLKVATLRSLLVKIVALVGLFVFVRTREDVMPFLILNLIAGLSNQVWMFFYLLKKEIKLSFKQLDIRLHFKPVVVLFASSIAISIYTMLDTIMLGFMTDYKQVGYYTSAVKISRILLPLVTAMSPIIIARINVHKGNGEQHQIPGLLSRSFDFMMLLAIPITIGLIIITPRFVPFFFGVEFIPVTFSMQVLSFLILIIGINNLYGIQVLLGMGEDKKFMHAVLVGTFINFTLNLFLIPYWGSVGASYASVIAEIGVTIIVIFFSLKIIRFSISVKNLLQIALSAFLFIPVSMMCDRFFIDNWSYLLFTITTSGIVYAVMLLLVFKNVTAISIIKPILLKFLNNEKTN